MDTNDDFDYEEFSCACTRCCDGKCYAFTADEIDADGICDACKVDCAEEVEK